MEMAARHTLVLSEDSSMFIRTWTLCGHTETFARKSVLNGLPPSGCAQCAAATQPKTARKRGEEVRDHWKELACSYIQRVDPHNFDRIVEEAKQTAQDKSKPAHELAGVPDACEAACISWYGSSRAQSSILTTLATPRGIY